MKQKQTTIEKTYYVYLLPLFLILLVLPLAIRRVDFFNYAASYPWNGGREHGSDIFLLCKRHILYFSSGIIAFFSLCFVLLRRKIFHMTKAIWFLGGYLFFALLSAIMTKNKYPSWHGAAELFQPLPVLVCYSLLFYYTYSVIRGERKNAFAARMLVFRFLNLLALLLGVLGVAQLAGQDPYQIPFLAKLCGIQEASFINSRRIYLSLYHSDYVGVLMTMLIPVNIASIRLEKTIPWKVLAALSAILSMLCLFASQSRSSILCLLLCGIAFLLLYGIHSEHPKKLLLRAGGIFTAAILLFALVNLWQGQSLGKRLFHYSNPIRKHLLALETKRDMVCFHLDQGQNYTVRTSGRKQQPDIEIRNADGETVPAGEGELNDLDIRTDYVTWKQQKIYGLSFRYRKQYIFVTNCLDNNGYYILNNLGRFDRCVLSPDALPVSAYGFASYRGYIWSKTLPLLKQTIITGAGPDNFEAIFPNNDYTSRHLAYLDHTIYNKPHNWFLQMATETGLISLLLMLCFLGLVIFPCFRRLQKSERQSGENHSMLCASLFSCCSYLLTCFFNDSMLVAAPVFWVLLGFSYALASPAAD